MDKQTAIEMKELSINAVESLGKILRLPNIGSDPIFHKKIHRAVGELIGEIEVKLHAEIYKEFPELGDLKIIVNDCPIQKSFTESPWCRTQQAPFKNVFVTFFKK